MNITFCINTSRNERYHVELLLKSIYKNFSRRDYPIIIYVENDNQGTVEFLKTQKSLFPNLKVIINPLPIPIGYGRNINMMFEMAETEIVSYLQSDMVVGPDYDIQVLTWLTPDTIISSTRVEPPLHPPSLEKITHDFGLDPQKFDLDAFSTFARQNMRLHQTDFWFAPFTLYKKTWLEIGGHDTIFRRSREDSDLLYRFSMKGIKTKQAWNAIVYHFTCTSSRGPEWWTEKAKQRTQLQQIADSIEMMKFLRKWPSFKHTSNFDPETEYKYQISINLSNPTTNDYDILRNYYKFYRIYVPDPITRSFLRREFDNLQNVANQLMDISEENWNKYKKYYHTWDSSEIFVDSLITDDDVIINLNLNGKSFGKVIQNPYYNNLNDLIHSIRSEEPGEYAIEEIGATMKINRTINRIQEQVKVNNPPLDFDFHYL